MYRSCLTRSSFDGKGIVSVLLVELTKGVTVGKTLHASQTVHNSVICNRRLTRQLNVEEAPRARCRAKASSTGSRPRRFSRSATPRDFPESLASNRPAKVCLRRFVNLLACDSRIVCENKLERNDDGEECRIEIASSDRSVRPRVLKAEMKVSLVTTRQMAWPQKLSRNSLATIWTNKRVPFVGRPSDTGA